MKEEIEYVSKTLETPNLTQGSIEFVLRALETPNLTQGSIDLLNGWLQQMLKNILR